MSRPVITATVLGALVGSVLSAGVVFAQADGATSAVSIDNFSFGPQTLTVKAGTTVTWTNKDDIPHGIASANNAFKRSPSLDTDDNYSFTFTTPGTYQYFCYLHPHMVGSIVVEAATGRALLISACSDAASKSIPLLAQRRHARRQKRCSLSGVKRT